jgi:two-component system sensor histidine kinase VicK
VFFEESLLSLSRKQVLPMVGRDRLALRLLTASLLAVALVIVVVAHREVGLRVERARVQGVSLARALSRIPVEELMASGRNLGPLELLKTGQGNRDFAYAVLVDSSGLPMADASRPGVAVPTVAMLDDPASWIGDRWLEEPSSGASIREFSSPVLEAGKLVGHVRIGFKVPGYTAVFEDPTFLGLVALCVFLLMPLSYFLVRREIAPIEHLSEQMGSQLADGLSTPLQLDATGSLKEFIAAFNQFVQLAEGRTEQLKGEKTQLLATSKVLEHEKRRYAALLEALPMGAVALDESGCATFVNTRLGDIADLDVDACVGRQPARWGADPGLARALELCAKNRRSCHEAVVNPLAPRRLEVTSQPIVGGESADGTLLLIRDVSGQALALEANADFLAHVAHELKSPLGVLGMYAESLLGPRGAEELHRIESCNTMQDEIERLGMLIETLLSIARIESGRVSIQPVRVRLPEFLADVLETSARGHEADLTFHLEAPDELSPVFIDKELLRIALNNLLTNGIKYNQPGGEVTLRAEENADTLSISVIDTGIGIRESELGTIFEKFSRSDDEVAQKRGGHGLGLSLAREIVRLHGGGIEVRSVPSEGSEFTARFSKTSALFRPVETA